MTADPPPPNIAAAMSAHKKLGTHHFSVLYIVQYNKRLVYFKHILLNALQVMQWIDFIYTNSQYRTYIAVVCHNCRYFESCMGCAMADTLKETRDNVNVSKQRWLSSELRLFVRQRTKGRTYSQQWTHVQCKCTDL